MTWIKMVAGRLKMDYRYSTDLVYNTFPWPQNVSSELHQAMEQSAQAILDARAQEQGATLAQLYDQTLMPATLRKAHQHNDRLVLKAYGFDPTWSQYQIFAALYQLYADLIVEEKARLTSIADKKNRRAKGDKAKSSKAKASAK